MEYIVILDPDTRNHSAIENSHGFIEKFAMPENAKQFGEESKADKDCKEYAIYQRVEIK